MSADNIVVIKKEDDGKLRGYHRSMSMYSEGQYDHVGHCMFCDGTGLDDKLIGGDGKCHHCKDGHYTPPKEDAIFEVDTVEEAICAYEKWYQQMVDEDDMGMFVVEYGYTFEGLKSTKPTDLVRCSDTELLDFLQQLTDKAAYTGKVVCRDSKTGRGWRLHETSRYYGVSDVRQAIMNYMKDLDFKLGEPHRFTMYAIGQNDEHDGIGMWDGPNPSEEEMLAVDGRDENSVIVRFNKDGSDEIIYTWASDCWVEVKMNNNLGGKND